MRYSIETVTYSDMGDHAERVRTSHVTVENESVEDAIKRVFPRLGQRFMSHNPSDEIIIRVMVEEDGTISGDEQARDLLF